MFHQHIFFHPFNAAVSMSLTQSICRLLLIFVIASAQIHNNANQREGYFFTLVSSWGSPSSSMLIIPLLALISASAGSTASANIDRDWSTSNQWQEYYSGGLKRPRHFCRTASCWWTSSSSLNECTLVVTSFIRKGADDCFWQRKLGLVLTWKPRWPGRFTLR